MSSKDRTLLANLGFSDPDKREPRHDLACHYLSQREQHRKIVEMIYHVRLGESFERYVEEQKKIGSDKEVQI